MGKIPLPTNPRFKDITGEKYGRLTVREYVGSCKGRARWRCKCECGKEKIADGKHLRKGNVKSCGCLVTEIAIQNLGDHIIEGRNPGKSRHELSSTYDMMIGRCENPDHPGYKYYGGRGIKVCKRWRQSFWDFVADVGQRPIGMTLDRKNNNGHYEPGNTQWATRAEQSHNMRSNTMTPKPVREIRALHGEGKRFVDIVRILGWEPTPAVRQNVRSVALRLTWNSVE